MENKIPTVEEFFDFIPGEIAYPPDFVHRTAIEFAKLHVEAALKAAAEIVDMEVEKDFLTKDVILNAYTLTDIK